MKWLKKLFGKTEGAFVEVHLDYGFGDIVAGDNTEIGPFEHTLYISDLSSDDAKKKLKGKRFDWHLIHSHWRFALEINGIKDATWEQVATYLKDEE